MNCPICDNGPLVDRLVEQWMKQGDHWVLFRNVPALVCDLCDEHTFDQDRAERMLQILRDDSSTALSTSMMIAVYDLSLIDLAADRSKLMCTSLNPVDIAEVSSDPGWRVLQPANTSVELSNA